MLKKFEITGYKNFYKTFVLNFSKIRDYKFNTEAIHHHLVNTAIIYGKNTVGKTNFGTAILDIKNNIINKDTVVSTNKNYLNADTLNKNAIFSYEFLFGRDEVNYVYKKDNHAALVSEELSINSELIYQYDHLEEKLLKNNLDTLDAQTLNWEFVEDTQSIFSYIINNTSLATDHPMKKMYNFIRGMD